MNLVISSLCLIAILLSAISSQATDYAQTNPRVVESTLIQKLQAETGYKFNCRDIESREAWACVKRLNRLIRIADQIPKDKNFTEIILGRENYGLNFGGKAFISVEDNQTDEDIIAYLKSLQTLPEQYEFTQEYRKESFNLQNEIMEATSYMVVCNEHRMEYVGNTRELKEVGLSPETCVTAYKNIKAFFEINWDIIGKDITGLFINTTDVIPAEMQMTSHPKDFTPVYPLSDDPEMDMWGHLWVNIKDLKLSSNGQILGANALRERLLKRRSWGGRILMLRNAILKAGGGKVTAHCSITAEKVKAELVYRGQHIDDKTARKIANDRCEEGFSNVLKYVTQHPADHTQSFIIVDKHRQLQPNYEMNGNHLDLIMFPYNRAR